MVAGNDNDRVGTVRLIEAESKDSAGREDGGSTGAPLLGGQREARASPTDTAEEEEDEPKEFDIPEDAYGAAILAICKNLPDVLKGEDRGLNLFMVLFSLGINTLNLCLQFGVVYFISSSVVQPKVSEVQFRYQDFHEKVFHHDGTFDADLWEDYDGKDELCQIAMTNRVFYGATLFLWVVTMLREFRSSERLFSNVARVPGCQFNSEMLEQVLEGSESKTYIVKVTTPVRLALYWLVCIPKLAICSALMWLGCSWLSATTKFEDLVLNAVAMGFVTDIDGMLYDVLIPPEYQQEVADINFKLPALKGHPQELRRQGLWTGFRRSAYWFIASLVFLYVYSTYLQNVLPPNIDDVKTHCAKWLDEEAEPHCGSNMYENLKAVFLHGSVTSTCYSYGPPIEK